MVAFISPYLGLKKIVDQVILADGYPVKSLLGNLRDGLRGASDLYDRDRLLVISRGGTAKLIRESLDVQVLEVDISLFDLLDVFKPFIGNPRKIGVVGFESLVAPSRKICQSLEIDSSYYQIQCENDVFQRMDEIRQDGIECMIGDVISARIAEQYGIEFHLIESGQDSVRQAIEKALAIEENLNRELESFGKMKALFDTVQEGIVAIDRDGNISTMNRKAKEFLEKGQGDLIGFNQSLKQVIPDFPVEEMLLSSRPLEGVYGKIRSDSFVFNGTPVFIKDKAEGAVILFQPIGELQKIEQKVRSQIHKKGLVAKYRFRDFFHVSSLMDRCLDTAKQYGGTMSNILIIGETGTGKEVMAQSIHNASPVKDGPFVAINCSALPGPLMESELFGHTEGAFTGAMKGGKTGLIEMAHQGTLFLDEINALDIDLQSKLLRVLQEREIMRIGGDKVIPVSIRIISAANQPLDREIREGRFRQDLYYRLNVLDIPLPTLRERREDILPFFYYLLDQKKRQHHIRTKIALSPEFIGLLHRHTWPGNTRELENWAEKYAVLSQLHQSGSILEYFEKALSSGTAPRENKGDALLEGSLKAIERSIIEQILDQEGGNISRTAARLRIDRNTLKRKLQDADS